MIKKQIINHLLANGGKLKDGETWISMAEEFGIEPSDKKRAKKDEKYRNKTIGRVAQRYWQQYVKQVDRLKVQKQIFVDGKLKFETFKEGPKKPQLPSNPEDFEIEKYTTNPYGGAWMKLKRKTSTVETFKDILESTEIKAWGLPKKNITGNSDFMIIISDTHIGAKTSNGEEYTKEVYKVRLQKIVETIIQQQTEPYKRFIIVHLGDWLDSVFTNSEAMNGLTTRGGHNLPTKYTPMESFKIAYETHLSFIKSLRAGVVHEEMEVMMMTNTNHDSDAAFAASTCCEIHLKYLDPSIKYTTSTKFIETFEIGDTTVGLSHGKDREYLNRPLPRVMTEKVENYLISYCLNNNINPKKFICLSGDQHNWSDTFSQNLRYIKCPSLFGSSEHSEMNYGRSIIGFATAEFKKNSSIKSGVIIKPELL